MDWKKAKTILLLVLLCTNLFMVCNLAWQVSRVKGQQRQAMNEALSLLRQEVGDFDEDLFRDLGTQPAVYRFERDRQKEEQIAQALLGDSQREDEGGGITQFRSQAGQLEFRSGGVVTSGIDPAAAQRPFGCQLRAGLPAGARAHPHQRPLAAAYRWDKSGGRPPQLSAGDGSAGLSAPGGRFGPAGTGGTDLPPAQHRRYGQLAGRAFLERDGRRQGIHPQRCHRSSAAKCGNSLTAFGFLVPNWSIYTRIVQRSCKKLMGKTGANYFYLPCKCGKIYKTKQTRSIVLQRLWAASHPFFCLASSLAEAEQPENTAGENEYFG